MSSVSPPPSLDAELRQLQQLIEQRQFDDALASSDRLLEQFPGHRDLLYMRAVALRHLHRVPEALATLETLEDTHPAYPRLRAEPALLALGTDHVAACHKTAAAIA